MYSTLCVCVVFSSHLFWTSSSLDVPAGVTGGSSHRISHPPSSFCGACLYFLARRIQPFLSLVDREVELCVLTNTCWAFFCFISYVFFSEKKSQLPGFELTF